MGNTATTNKIFIIDKLGGVTKQISVYFKNRIPGQWGHPGPFRDKGTKSSSVPDVPGWLATMGYRFCIIINLEFVGLIIMVINCYCATLIYPNSKNVIMTPTFKPLCILAGIALNRLS